MTVRDLVEKIYPNLENIDEDIKEVLKCDPNLKVTPLGSGRYRTKIGIIRREEDTSELGYSFE